MTMSQPMKKVPNKDFLIQVIIQYPLPILLILDISFSKLKPINKALQTLSILGIILESALVRYPIFIINRSIPNFSKLDVKKIVDLNPNPFLHIIRP